MKQYYLDSENEPQRLDNYHSHEVLDRTHVILKSLNDNLLEHPYIESNPELQNKVEDISELLFELYQDVGRIDYGKTYDCSNDCSIAEAANNLEKYFKNTLHCTVIMRYNNVILKFNKNSTPKKIVKMYLNEYLKNVKNNRNL